MKTRNILAALAMTVCMFATTAASAQGEPAIKIYPTDDVLKVVFGYESKAPVTIDFIDNNGVLTSDRVEGIKYEKGFMKKYRIQRDSKELFWVHVRSEAVSASFKITTNSKGQYISNLETVTYNHPIAKR